MPTGGGTGGPDPRRGSGARRHPDAASRGRTGGSRDPAGVRRIGSFAARPREACGESRRAGSDHAAPCTGSER